METLIRRDEYSQETIAILEHLGEDRLNVLQVVIANHSNEGDMPSARRLIEAMVVKHTNSSGVDMAELGYGTIADAIAEIGASKNATKALLKGKMGLQRAVDAHRQRAVQAAASLDKARLRELGVAATPTIYVDEPTDLHLVHLVTPEHCQYEGARLVHWLGNIATASAYLARGALLYSLREGGTEPRVTLEVDAGQRAVTQARQRHDQPLHEDSVEYHALLRSLEPLATHVSTIAPAPLTITDKVLRRQ